MKLILVDMNAGVCAAWQEYFKALPEVEIINDYFENLPEYDCMVSAANSFGLMDGGVDAAITRFFGEGVMRRVQERIIAEYLGEQPVGTCMLVDTGNPKHPWIAHAPTMRIPMEIAHTDNVYLAMWAVLRAIHQHNQLSASPINVIACPGLGTFTGKVPYREAARQMSLAYKNYLNPPTHITWRYASERQARVRFGGDDGFHFPTA